jgi:hypothetical protein
VFAAGTYLNAGERIEMWPFGSCGLFIMCIYGGSVGSDAKLPIARRRHNTANELVHSNHLAPRRQPRARPPHDG